MARPAPGQEGGSALHTPMTRLNRFVVDHPWWVVLFFLMATARLAVRVPALHIETDIMSMMPEKHPVFVFNEYVEDYFDLNHAAMVGVVNRGPDGVFTPQTLGLVKHLSEAIGGLPLIDGDDLVSLSELDNITGDGEGMYVDPFYDTPPASAEEARAIRHAVFDNEMLVGAVVSEDAEATVIVAEIVHGADKVELYRMLREIVAAAPVTDEEVFIAGPAVVQGEMTTLARQDIQRMFPLVILASAVLLFATLRSLRGVMLPIAIVVLSVVWTLGLMAWVHGTFFAIMSMIPSLLTAIGVADGIHVIHRYLLGIGEEPERPVGEVVFQTMQEMARPVVMTSLTTAAGFLALAVSPMRPIRGLGVFTAFGVLAAMVASLTLLPAVLAVLPVPRRAAARAIHTQKGRGGIVAALLDALTPLVTGHPLVVMSGGALLVLVGAVGFSRVVVDGSLLQNFPKRNPVRLADARLREYFTGTTPLEIVLDGGAVDAWKNPEKLRAVERFQAFLEASPHQGQTRSIVDLLKRMNLVMNPEDPDAFRVPDNRELVAQYLFLYSISGDPDDFSDIIDYDYRKANVRARVDSDHSPVLKAALDRVQAYAAAHLAPLGIETTTSGQGQWAYTFMDLIVVGQVRSLILAIVMVACLTALMCRAASAGLYGIIPVSVASILNFGLLAWFGVPLTVTTALLSNMGIGIGVDYAIHFIVKYQRVRQKGMAPEAAMHATLATTGVAIFYNALVVVAGFLVLATSAFVPNRVLGLLVAGNMLVCFLGTVTAMAAALHWGQPAFVRPIAAQEQLR